jgi:hypothetical protein
MGHPAKSTGQARKEGEQETRRVGEKATNNAFTPPLPLAHSHALPLITYFPPNLFYKT